MLLSVLCTYVARPPEIRSLWDRLRAHPGCTVQYLACSMCRGSLTLVLLIACFAWNGTSSSQSSAESKRRRARPSLLVGSIWIASHHLAQSPAPCPAQHHEKLSCSQKILTTPMHSWGCEATRSWEKMWTSWKANRYSRADGLTSWRWPCRPCRSFQPPTSCNPPLARHCRRRPRRPLSSRAEPMDSSSRGAAGSRRRGGGGSERWRWRVWWTCASAATPRPAPRGGGGVYC